MNLAYNGHDIKALATVLKNGNCGVEVTVEWLEGTVDKKKKFGPYEIFSSQNDAESWGLLAALRWIDTGKRDTDALVTLAGSVSSLSWPALQDSRLNASNGLIKG